jgi:hypothetical protein
MEDCLVDQREVEKDMDEMFADRRLFHDAETDAPELKAEIVAPLVSSSELASRLQAQQEMVDSKANAATEEEPEVTHSSDPTVSVDVAGADDSVDKEVDPSLPAPPPSDASPPVASEDAADDRE